MAAYEDLWLNHRVARARAAARRPGRALRRVRDAAGGARRPRVPARRGAAASTWRQVRARALEAPVSDGELHELVIRHELQHTETMLQAMALAGMLAAVTSAGRHAVRRRRAGDGRGRRGPVRARRGRRTASPTTTSARATRSPPAASRSAARRSPTPPGRRSTRTAATRAASGGRRTAGRGAPSTTSATTRADRPTRRSSTSASTRPTPSPAPTTPASRPRSSGRRRRRSSRASARSGSGRASPFTGYPGFKAHPYREYSEVFFGDRYRVLRGGSVRHPPARRLHTSSATGTSPNAGSSSPESGSRDEDGVQGHRDRLAPRRGRAHARVRRRWTG